VRAVAQAEAAAQGKLAVEAGREQRQRQVGDTALIDQALRLLHAAARPQTVLAEHLLAGDPPVIVAHAVQQHRNAEALQQQRQQWRQIGVAARAVVGRDDHRADLSAGRASQGRQARVRGGEKAAHFIDRFGLHAQRDGDRPEFEIRDLAIEHRAVELLGVAA
jgi:hypothetical protein